MNQRAMNSSAALRGMTPPPSVGRSEGDLVAILRAGTGDDGCDVEIGAKVGDALRGGISWRCSDAAILC